MAYIEPIEPNSSDSHQTSPTYMLTFLRWANRDTANFSDAEFLDLREPLVVINDCISLNVSSSKSSHTHTANMVLLAGDLNYSTALAPGDYVFINMLNDEKELFGDGGTPESPKRDCLYDRASNLKSINRSKDGFKGVFKIQSVRRNLHVDPQSGVKTYFFQIQAAAFTEFNQVVYFNPLLFDKGETKGAFATLNIGASDEWNSAVDKQQYTVDIVIRKLIGFLIGQGFDKKYIPQKTAVTRNHNRNFLIPSAVGALLGISASAKILTAADMFNYYLGIESYNKSGAKNMAEGLNPSGARDGHFIQSKPLSGTALLLPEPWSQVTAWSILQQYSNSLINEMYTTFKMTPEGSVRPCLVLRQKPFTSSNFAKKHAGINKTDFLSLPRWKISTKLIESVSLGRDEAARINFVHIVGKAKHVDAKSQVAQQASLNSFKIDEDDVKRNGLKPIITSCDFDFKTGAPGDVGLSPIWNALYFDWVSNGHLKENGTIVCTGITKPIPVGDNLQLENTVYHIESVGHSMSIDQRTGSKTFKTTLQLSFGVDAREDRKNYNPIYAEMQYTDSYSNRVNNHSSGILPGFSDAQDIAGRVNGEEIQETKEKAFSIAPKKIKDPTKDEE